MIHVGTSASAVGLSPSLSPLVVVVVASPFHQQQQETLWVMRAMKSRRKQAAVIGDDWCDAETTMHRQQEQGLLMSGRIDRSQTPS